MPWPSYGNAYGGSGGPDLPLPTYILSGGQAVPANVHIRRNGTWIPVPIYQLPADLTEPPPPPPPPDTTTINISALLAGSENLSGLNNTVALQNCLNRLVRKTGAAASITSPHVTLDWENTYFLSEDSITLPTNGDLQSGIYHVCHNWPKGMTWQNGGIRQNTDDGYLNGSPNPNQVRNRYGIMFQQGKNRPEPENAEQWFVLDNWWFKGAHTYAKTDYVLAREGQEAIWLVGQQWFYMLDCQIEQPWGDCVNFQRGANLVNPGRDNEIYPGMVNIEGGRFQRPGVMHITLNQVCAPDAVKTAGFWKNDPDHLDWVEGENIFPSASGNQYGLWWHGNATHPFVAIDGKRSQVDIEPQASYDPIQDVTIGADDGNRENFRLTHPALPGGNFIQSGPGWMQLRRFKIQHVKRENGGCGIFFRGSPDQLILDTTGATADIAASMNGLTLPRATITLTADVPQGSGNWTKPGQVALKMPGAGWTCVQYTSFSGPNLTGCTTGVGTMTTGMDVRTINGYKDAANTTGLPAGGVVLGAKGSLFNGTGILPFDFFWGNPRPDYIRVWTESGLAILKTTGWTDPNDGPFTGVTVQTGTGWTVKSGMAITAAFKTPERAKYTIGDIIVDDYWWDNANAPSRMFTIQRAASAQVTNCRGPYTTETPFGDIVDVPTFNKGGTSTYGNNTFFKQGADPLPTRSQIIAGAGLADATVLTSSGSLNITTAGQVIQNLDISGNVNVRADGVRFFNCRIRGAPGTALINVISPAKNLTVERCELIPIQGATINDNPNGSIICQNGATVRQCYIHGYADGIKAGNNSLYELNYIRMSKPSGSDKHLDGIQGSGRSNYTIRRNVLWMDCAVGGNFGAFAQAFDGTNCVAITGILIEENYIYGGNFGVQVAGGKQSTCPGNYQNLVTNTIVRNNRIIRDDGVFGPATTFPNNTGFRFGYFDLHDIAGGVTLTGNIMEDGSPLDHS